MFVSQSKLEEFDKIIINPDNTNAFSDEFNIESENINFET